MSRCGLRFERVGARSIFRLAHGIGSRPADYLKAHGVNVLVDLPGVGQNLQRPHAAGVAFRSRIATVGGSAVIGESGLVHAHERRAWSSRA